MPQDSPTDRRVGDLTEALARRALDREAARRAYYADPDDEQLGQLLDDAAMFESLACSEVRAATGRDHRATVDAAAEMPSIRDVQWRLRVQRDRFNARARQRRRRVAVHELHELGQLTGEPVDDCIRTYYEARVEAYRRERLLPPLTRTHATHSAPRTRTRGAGRPGRRAGASSSTSSSDPGDPDPASTASADQDSSALVTAHQPTRLSMRTVRGKIARDLLQQHGRDVVERHLDRCGWTTTARETALGDADEPSIVGRLRDAGFDPSRWELAPNTWASRCPRCRIAPSRRWLKVTRPARGPLQVRCSNGCTPQQIVAALDEIGGPR